MGVWRITRGGWYSLDGPIPGHALNQVVHFDTEVARSERFWVYGCNANLPKGVVVIWARVVAGEFHARFSARRRSYRYVIFNRHARPTFIAYRVCWEYRRLDAQRMQQAATHLVGKHDFNAYRAAGCQAKSPDCCLRSLNHESPIQDSL